MNVTNFCFWTYDDIDDKYDTECGKAWFFMEGTAADNEVKFCPYCGKRVEEAKTE